MARASTAVSWSAAVLVALGGGYAVADAHDLVPGRITVRPVLGEPAAFPAFTMPATLAYDDPIPSLGTDAPLPSSAEIQRLASALNADTRIGGGASVGVSVVDIASGRVLAEVKPDTPQIPASNMKVLTAAAVEWALPGDRRLVTSVTWSGEPDGQKARLTLVAGGDMLLVSTYGHQGKETSPNGFAGVEDLADGVVAALEGTGVTTVSLVVDDHAFGGASIPSSWTWAAVDDGYCAPPTGLAINIGLVPGTNEDPERYRDPSLNVGEVLAEKLRNRGLVVESVAKGRAGSGDRNLAMVESAPLADVVHYMVWYSENTIAEMLLRLLALDRGRTGSTEEGAAEARRILEARGLDLTGVVWADGSGFARKNRLTPSILTDLLVLLARDPDHDSLLEHLPIAALRGTLYDRFRSTEGAGVVRGKTGSLGGVTSLSGTVVTADGRWLAYAILADGLPWGQERPRAAIDEFLSQVAACGC